MNVLITGVTSFIGRALAEELIDEGYTVYGVVRPDSKNREGLPKKLNIVECDVSDTKKLLISELSDITVCVHLAWDGIGAEGRRNPEIQESNVKNTLQLIPALKQLGCERFLFAGSQAEYGICNHIETEDTECNPVSEYGKAKLKVLALANAACKSCGMTYIHMRIFSVYGPGDHETSLINSCVKAFAEGGHISLGACTQKWNYLYVKDCAKAIADLISCPVITDKADGDENNIINIASENTKPLRSFVEDIKAIIGKGSYDCDRPDDSPEGAGQLDPDITRLKLISGFKENTTFTEGIKNIEKMYSLRS